MSPKGGEGLNVSHVGLWEAKVIFCSTIAQFGITE